MSYFLVDIWMMILPSVLLLPMYAWTFFKVYVGSRFTIVLVMIALLFAGNVGNIVQGIGQYGVMLHHQRDNEETIFKWDCISGGGMTLANLCFNESHWMLAVFYFKMAQNMPRVIANNPADPLRSYSVLSWIGLVLNAVFPVALGVSFMLVCYYKYNTGDKQWADELASYTATGTYCGQIISGCLLVWSVFRVSSYMRARQITG